MRLAALTLALLMLRPAACFSQAWTRQYGGSREDRLNFAVSAGGGLLLAGYTLSTDGNLSMRTREGKAGWLLRLSSEGSILWSYCSAHVGRDEMTAPFAHADGTVSVTLKGDGRGSEWLHLDDRGQLLERVEMPEPEMLCTHGGGKMMYGEATDVNGEPHFRVHVNHADASACSHLFALDGSAALEGVFPPRRIPDDPENAPTWKYSPDGHTRAETSVLDGELHVVFSHLGSEETLRVKASAPQGRMYCVPDYLYNTDGTLIVNTQLENGYGVITRVSETGEVLFSHSTDGGLQYMILTGAGFAGTDGNSVLYFDEDGNLLAQTELPQDFEVTGLAPFGDGAAAVDCVSQGAKNMVFANDSYTPGDLLDWYDGMIYTGMDMRVLEAQKRDGGVLMLLEHRDGWRTVLSVDAQGQARESAAAIGYDGPSRVALSNGSVRFEEEPFAAQVIRLNADGSEAWSMRTPIHTAADRLVWRCACEMEDGSLVLGGCFVTGTKTDDQQQAAIAHISSGGVLMRMETVEGAADICAMLRQGDGMAALVNVDEVLDGGVSGSAQAVRWIGGERDGEEKLLLVFLNPDSAWLFPGPGDVPLAVGTSESGGRLAAVVQWAEDRDIVRAGFMQ